MNNDDIENVIDFIFSDGYKEITTVNDFLKKIEGKDKEIERLNNIINETKEYLEYQISQLDFYEDTKAKMLGSMAIVLLKGSDKK